MENIFSPIEENLTNFLKTKKVGWTVKMWVTGEHTVTRTNIPYINYCVTKEIYSLKYLLFYEFIHLILLLQDRDSEIQRKKRLSLFYFI